MVELNKYYGKNNKKKIIFGSSYNLNQKLLIEKQLNNEVIFGIPHFLIDKKGVIHEILNHDFNSRFTGTIEDVDSISILLEHEGYLKLNGDDNQYYDAFGTIYNKKNFIECIWRDKCFWVKYSRKQMDTLKKLCKQLCEDNNIIPDVVTSNIKSKEMLSKTILGRSNISNFFQDPNPSFKYQILKELENEL